MFSPSTFAASLFAVLLVADGHSTALSRAAAITKPPPDACTLLTVTQVSEALEVPSQAGQHMLPNNTTACVWSNEVGIP